MKKSFLLSIVFVAFMLTSCISYYEKLFINEDGSGRLEYTIATDSSSTGFIGANSMKLIDTDSIQHKISSIAQISGCTVRHYTDSGKVGYTVSLSFASLEGLEKVLNYDNKDVTNKIEVSKQSDGNMKFVRHIMPKEAKKKSEGKNELFPDADKMWDGVKFTYEVNLPGKIISADGGKQIKEIDKEKGTVKWSVAYSDIENDGVALSAIYEVRSGLFCGDATTISAIVAVVILCFIAGFFFMTRRKKGGL